MSAEVQESSGKRGKGKQKKMTVRVDFTPMVDMNMLLITFFMLCTTLSKPQTMEISMPSNDKDITEQQKSMVKASQAITLLLGADNKLYYYEGEPNYKDYTSLKETSYGANGLRAVLLQKNAAAVNQVRALKQQKLDLKITDDEYKKKVSEIKSGKNGKSKQKKFAVRVDFTPMVDMNMLLITFFMLCTTLSKPQTMEISMPSNDKSITEQQKSMVKASQAITLLLGADNKLYYYEGEPNYKDYTSLKETSYTPDGIRSILLQKNAAAVNKVRALKQQKLDLKISEEEYRKQVSEIKSGKDTPTVIIKATDDASYKNLIDALDEMQICNIGKYVITDIAEADEFLMKNLDEKGALSQNLADK